MRIVIDTNVIASAVFFGGKPYQLLHYIMEGRVVVVASKEIVDEYEEIVLRHCRPLSLSKGQQDNPIVMPDLIGHLFESRAKSRNLS